MGSPSFLGPVSRMFLASTDHHKAPEARGGPLSHLGLVEGPWQGWGWDSEFCIPWQTVPLLLLIMGPWILGAISRSPLGPLVQREWGDLDTPLTVLVTLKLTFAASTLSGSWILGGGTYGRSKLAKKTLFLPLCFLQPQTRKEHEGDPKLGG